MTIFEQHTERLQSTYKPAAIRNSHTSDKVAAELSNNVHPLRTPESSKQRWLCSVAEHVKFSRNVKNAIHVRPSKQYSQYELIVSLLKAETCDVIYFDCQFTSSQIGILKMLQLFSGTELVHARIAMQFDMLAMG